MTERQKQELYDATTRCESAVKRLEGMIPSFGPLQAAKDVRAIIDRDLKEALRHLDYIRSLD